MEAELNGMTVLMLRKELKERGLPQNGKKQELIARIVTYEQEKAASRPADESSAPHDEKTLVAEKGNAEAAGDTMLVDAGPVDGAPLEKEDVATSTSQDGVTSTQPETTASPSTSSDHKLATPAQTDITVSIPPEVTTSEPSDITVSAQANTTATSTHPDIATSAQADFTVSAQTEAQPETSTVEAHPEIPALAPSNLEESAEISTAPSVRPGPDVAASMAQDSPPTPVVETDIKDVDNDIAMATEIVEDIVSRKRRSRSPPPEGEESAAKRARNDHETVNAEVAQTETTYVEEPIGTDPAEAEPTPAIDRDDGDDYRMEDIRGDHGFEENRVAAPQHDIDVARQEQYETYESGQVERSQHPATSALYIKNFMRPLRDAELRDHLCELATPPGRASDYYCIHEFYLDSIRTHAFVSFDSISAAARVRNALHGRVWPNERNRKQLWVDFIPAETITDWVQRERSSESRTSRWGVVYETDPELQDVVARHVLENETAAAPSFQQQPLAPPPVPTAIPGSFSVDQEVPLGPRRRNRRGQTASNLDLAEPRVTTTGPPITWQPVSEALANQRIQRIRSYYTRDRHRDLGRPEEINRYTFEHSVKFVDRGKENFVGIRPPHREAERRRQLARGDDYRPRRSPSPRRVASPLRRQPGRDRRHGDRYDDRYDGGGRSRHDRSRSRQRNDEYRSGRDEHRSGRDEYRSGRDDMRSGRDDYRSDRGAPNDGILRSRLTGLPLEEYPGSSRNHGRSRRSRR